MATRTPPTPPARDIRAAQLIATAISQLAPRGTTLNPAALAVINRWERMIEHQQRMPRVARNFFRRFSSAATPTINTASFTGQDHAE